MKTKFLFIALLLSFITGYGQQIDTQGSATRVIEFQGGGVFKKGLYLPKSTDVSAYPNVPLAGKVRYNVVTNLFECHNGTSWVGYPDYTYVQGTFVPIVGDVTMSGNKTFNNSPNVPNGSNPSHAVNKGQLDLKQDLLISGTNLKTVNNNSLVGSGNVAVGDIFAGGQTSAGLLKIGTNSNFDFIIRRNNADYIGITTTGIKFLSSTSSAFTNSDQSSQIAFYPISKNIQLYATPLGSAAALEVQRSGGGTQDVARWYSGTFGSDLVGGVRYDGRAYGTVNAAAEEDYVRYIQLLQAKRPYKVYTALISQSGTDAPTVIELENTIGIIEWSYDSTGSYNANNGDGVFQLNKTAIFMSPPASGTVFFSANRVDFSTVNIKTRSIGASLTDAQLNNVTIEIRVYTN